MKKRVFWLFVAVMIAGGAVYFARQKQMATPPVAAGESPPTAPTPPPAAVPAGPAPVVSLPLAPPPAATTVAAPSAPPAKPRADAPEVPIQDGATIDFSIGAPVVRSGGEDQEALDRSLQEMKEAVKDVKFSPKK